MGCNSSSLAGDSFDGIDATALSTKKAPRRSQKSPYPAESDLSAEAYAHATPTMTRGDRGPDPETKEGKKEKSTLGSHMGTLPFNSRPKVKVVSSLDPSAGRAIDDINPPDPPRKLYLDGKELKPKQKQTSFSTAAMPWTDVSKRVDADGEAAEEAGASKLPFKPVSVGSRTDEDRMAAIPAGKKKLGLYQRYTNYRLGVGEGECAT